MTQAMVELTEKFYGIYGYLFLGLCACLENIIPPIPGDTVTVFGGYLTGIGRLNIFGVIFSTTIGSFAGFMIMFFFGKLVGENFFSSGKIPWFQEQQLHRVSAWFERFGYRVVLANRFLSGARSVISMFAGITHLRTRTVAIYGLISCLVWNSCLIFAGYKVGNNWGSVTEILKKYNIVVVLLLVSAAIVFLARKYLRKTPKCFF